MRKTYNKLVRDKIPGEIRRQGRECVCRVASAAEVEPLMIAKLQEEVAEFAESRSVEELADILEVLQALAALKGTNPVQLEEARKLKAEQKGGFRERIILLETS
ncbi:MAG: nucleoside triphosphate pyrophosphohydrolase [Planctomycetes bacterium]|nr:nucleoside triphosphate pyrophosphohydrolase [Planctomycetota bacterium]